MQKKDTWLLPEGITEVLPEQAARLEQLRNRLLNTFDCWGYRQVIPPFVDFLDSLLTGSAHDLDLQTFKLTDPLSGELLGIRADMTPQVARIDAHNLHHAWPNRLCYVGTVLQTVGDPLQQSRSPMQIGAELYGHSGIASDYEIISLMLETLALCGIQNVHLDLGHVGIYRALVAQAGLSCEQETELFDILQRKAIPELTELVNAWPIDALAKKLFTALPRLNGGATMLAQAQALFNAAPAELQQALQDLTAISQQLCNRYPSLSLSFDLAELRGYHYHTGLVFAAFVPARGKEIARGGRYDNIGAVFGRARAATGFSADLRVLALLASSEDEQRPTVWAPAGDDADLAVAIRDLRAAGTRVIQHLPGQDGDAVALGCTAQLEQHQQQWLVKPLLTKG
jgi:ATP phosphoribosyltransferase regulatory subunit